MHAVTVLEGVIVRVSGVKRFRRFFTALDVGSSRTNNDSAVGRQVVPLCLVTLETLSLPQGFELFLLFFFLWQENRVMGKQVLLDELDVLQVALRKSTNGVDFIKVKKADAEGPTNVLENFDRVGGSVLLFGTVGVLY